MCIIVDCLRCSRCGNLVLSNVLTYYVKCMFALSVFFFKQDTAYEMRISDWSSDVCSSDLPGAIPPKSSGFPRPGGARRAPAIFLQRYSRPVRKVEIGRASCRERVCQYV